jgi:hypothetical protein
MMHKCTMHPKHHVQDRPTSFGRCKDHVHHGSDLCVSVYLYLIAIYVTVISSMWHSYTLGRMDLSYVDQNPVCILPFA